MRQIIFMVLSLLILAACTDSEMGVVTEIEKRPLPTSTSPPTSVEITATSAPHTHMPESTPTHTPVKVYPTKTATSARPARSAESTRPVVNDEQPLPPIINDMWMSGIFQEGEFGEECPFQVGSISDESVGEAYPPWCFTLMPANEEVADQLTAVPPLALIRVTGTLDTTIPDMPPPFTVTQLAYINYPYSPTTPLDVTYSDKELGIAMDYPSGWGFLRNWAGYKTVDSYPKDNDSYGPGIEYADPTRFYMSYYPVEQDTVAEWVSEKEGVHTNHETSQLQIGPWPVTRIQVDEYGIEVSYALEINDEIIIFSTNHIGEDFMARVVSTLRPDG